ncbi:MAG: hypothetical protein C6Y22_09615 [Hapalosiphonaceae cyanobacterium JJU2]|nr:MAG: hypothetical protein C6Y22_09615 [Hapalosiphonaceae cyanobacterium JJU2]
MRVLIDTNILLDYLLDREPFVQDAKALFNTIDSGQVVGYVTATTLTDIFYIARRHTRSIDLARQAVSSTVRDPRQLMRSRGSSLIKRSLFWKNYSPKKIHRHPKLSRVKTPVTGFTPSARSHINFTW